MALGNSLHSLLYSSCILVYVWYLQHGLPVTPINARASEVTVGTKAFATAKAPSALDNPSQVSLSIITPPKITLDVLKDAKEAGVSAVWLQPGTFDDDVLAFARKEFQAVIAGMEDGTVGHEGWCVLMDGEDGLKIANRQWKKQKL
jgi:predicted CoA-binding protein